MNFFLVSNFFAHLQLLGLPAAPTPLASLYLPSKIDENKKNLNKIINLLTSSFLGCDGIFIFAAAAISMFFL